MDRRRLEPRSGCEECGGVLDDLRRAAGRRVCAELACQGALVRRRSREQAAARLARARRELSERGIEPDREAWSLVPAFEGVEGPLTPTRRDAFVAHLTSIVEDAGEGGPGEGGPGESGPGEGNAARADTPAAPPADITHLTHDEGRALEAGCGGCRGRCCRGGGTTAFLTTDSIRGLWSRRPDLSRHDTLAIYTDMLPDTHVEGSCVFHGATGCHLPREVRSDSCNRYLCAELKGALRSWREGASDGVGDLHHFVAVSAEDPSTVRVVATDRPQSGEPVLDRPASEASRPVLKHTRARRVD